MTLLKDLSFALFFERDVVADIMMQAAVRPFVRSVRGVVRGAIKRLLNVQWRQSKDYLTSNGVPQFRVDVEVDESRCLSRCFTSIDRCFTSIDDVQSEMREKRDIHHHDTNRPVVHVLYVVLPVFSPR